MIYIILYHKTN